MAQRLQVFEHDVVAVHRAVGAVAVTRHVLHIDAQQRIAAFAEAGVVAQTHQLGVPGAERKKRADGLLFQQITRKQIDRSAEGGLPQIAGVAGAALDFHAADHRGGEISGGVMRRPIGIAKRYAVPRDVVLTIRKAAHGGLGLAQAGAVDRDAQAHAGRNHGNR